MRAIFIVLMAVLASMLVAFAGTQEVEPKAQVSEITRLRAANAAMKQALIAAQFDQMKRAFDDAVAKAKADFQSASADLSAATAAAFKEADKSADKFDFNPSTGEFTEKPKASTEAPKAITQP